MQEPGLAGVRLLETLLDQGGLRASAEGYELTDAGSAWLASLGMQAPTPTRHQRFAYACMDGPNGAITWRASWPPRCSSTSSTGAGYGARRTAPSR